MNSKKVKEIKKALEHCGNKITCQGCPEYNNEPVIDWFKCKKNLLQKTITLINELESENERLGRENTIRQNLLNELREENGRLYDDIHKKGMQGLKKENNELKDRIAELEHKCDDCAGCTQWKCDCANIEMHAVEQFAERLKKKGKSNYDFFQCPTKENKVISISDTDETLKEFIND